MADIYKSKFTGQEIDDILTRASNASNAINIEANPSVEATEELTKLTIGETTYSIPEGTEGTVVVGNPDETPTEELTKLKVGDVVYSIPEQSETPTTDTRRYLTISATGLGAGSDKHFSTFIDSYYQSDTVKGLINATPMVTDGTYLFKLVASNTTVQAYQYSLSSISSPTIKNLGTHGLSIIPSNLTLTSQVNSDVQISLHYGAGGGSD